MKLKQHDVRMILLFCLVTMGMISFLAYKTTEERSVEVALFFPNIKGEYMGVMRYMPFRKDTALQARLFIEELVFGSRSLALKRALPPGTRVKHVIVKGRTCYIDLSASFVLEEGMHDDRRSYERILYNLTRVVSFNLRHIEKVVVTIEGQLPWESPAPAMTGDFQQ